MRGKEREREGKRGKEREREGNSRNNRNKQKGLNQKSFEWINVAMVFLEFPLRRYASSKYDS